MVNVIYVGKSYPDSDIKKKIEEQERYLLKCLDRYKCFLLTDSDKEFIKNLMIAVAFYMDCVLIEDDYNTSAFVQLLSTTVPGGNNIAMLFYLLKEAVTNEDYHLSIERKIILSDYLNKIKKDYDKNSVQLALQILQVDCMLNPNCSQLVSNILNLAVLKCNTKSTALITQLQNELNKEKNFSLVCDEFSDRFETLLKMKKSDLSDDELILYKYLDEKYSMLPITIQKKIEEYDFDIYLSDELFGHDWNLRKLGSTHINGNQIRVWLGKNKGIIDLSFYHEIGHVVDKIFCDDGFYSKTNEDWKETYEKDKDVYFQAKIRTNPELRELYEYGISSPTEYFACVFNDYVENKEWLEEVVPCSYEIIEKVIFERN